MDFRELLEKLRNMKKPPNVFEFKNNGGDAPKKIGKIKLLLYLPIIFIVISVIMSCQYTVEETEQAVVTTLGKVTSVETAGLHFKLPYPIQGVKKVEVNRTQRCK